MGRFPRNRPVVAGLRRKVGISGQEKVEKPKGRNNQTSNGLDDCESIGWVFHGFLRPIFMTASQSLTLRRRRFLEKLLKALRNLRPLVWRRNFDTDAFADVVCVVPAG